MDNHLIGQKHQYLSDQEDIPSTADKIKVMFSQKLRECRLNFNEGRPSASEQPSSSSQSVPAGNQLCGFNTESTKHRFKDGNHMSWALRKHQKATQFSENAGTVSRQSIYGERKDKQ